MNDERYDDADRYGERVAELLAAAAETIEPAPDGLVRIRERVTTRRRRRRWLRPTLAAVAAVAAAAAAVFAASVLLRGSRKMTLEPASAGVRVAARSAPDAAREFVRRLGFPALDEVTGRDGRSRVLVGRTIPESGRQVTVTAVDLQPAGGGWMVTGARAEGLRVNRPPPQITARSPLIVTGWLRGVDEAGLVEVRRYGSSRPLGQVPISGGGGATGQSWTVTVPFSGARSGETLLLVAWLGSSLDREPAQLVAVPIRAG